MGTIVDIKMIPPLNEPAIEAAFAEIARIERVFSPHRPNAGPQGTAEHDELAGLMARGAAVAAESGGAVDLRIRDWVDLWGWEAEPHQPRADEIERVRRSRASRALVGEAREYAFGAIAKGYAVDRSIDVLRRRGVTHALVNAGGEVRALGDGWVVGVQHPREPGALLARVALEPDRAVATSGDYENCFFVGGQRFHHLMVPSTGMPARGCQSMSVMAPTCEAADIWATALFVLGPARALEIVERKSELAMLAVDDQGQQVRSRRWPADAQGRT